jgi:hypothetical protein
MTGLPEPESVVVCTSMPQPTPQYEHAVRVTATGPIVGGQCFRLFSDDVIAVKIDAHRARSRPVSIVSAGQVAGMGAATRPISSPAPALAVWIRRNTNHVTMAQIT